jgi:hypothetical protein
MFVDEPFRGRGVAEAALRQILARQSVCATPANQRPPDAETQTEEDPIYR